ncbi:MAG: OmpA family protein [Saprospiraceae bacterium]
MSSRPEVLILSAVLFFWLLGLSVCHNATCPDCQTAAAAVPTTNAASLSFGFKDKDLNFSTATADNLLFANGSCEYVTPLSTDLRNVFTKTVQHLENNTKRVLVLTGLYENGETNSCTDASDLGIARAEQIKELLVGMGAPADRIVLEASEQRDLQDYKNMLAGGFDYMFKDLEVATEPEILGEAALRSDKITLYFESNEQEINLTSKQRNYLNSLKIYLAANPSAKAEVTGHTDSAGKDAWNMRLSRKRSEFVRNFMIEQGIPKRQIRNEGIGPDEPIASNETEEGKALNRRVEITLE